MKRSNQNIWQRRKVYTNIREARVEECWRKPLSCSGLVTDEDGDGNVICYKVYVVWLYAPETVSNRGFPR